MNFFTFKEVYNFHLQNTTIYDTFYHYMHFSLLPNDEREKIMLKLGNNNVYHQFKDIDDTYVSKLHKSDYVLFFCRTIYENSESLFNRLKLQIRKSLYHKKKIIIFDGSDDETILELKKEYGYIFKTSGFLSKKKENVFGCPTLNEDYFENNYLNKKLSIGFCGQYQNSHPTRRKILEKFFDVEYSNFVLRDKWANIDDFSNGKLVNSSDKKLFLDNLNNNLYGLCMRGWGNFSFRLGEIFMMGRIPILIDTDCILPFEQYIPYHKNTIYIKYNDLNHIHDIIQKYHQSHTEEELINIQKENRKIWLEYFTPTGSFKNTIRLLKDL